ncbi:MAG: CoA-binding protein [Ignavibacteriaceae bacterium]|jgi:predicted CoA-binding protein|nr:CoA-binding protein [Ignavibacteriaceae bacterium]
MTSKKIVEEFLIQKKIAVVGVSRTKTKFGNAIYKELKQKGYDVFPVNPNLQTFEGDVCYPDLLSIPDRTDAVVINVPPVQAEKVIREANQAGIKKVWLQQGSQSDSAVKYCEENGIDCISNECILMFAQPSAFIHRAHKWIWGVLGKLPG